MASFVGRWPSSLSVQFALPTSAPSISESSPERRWFPACDCGTERNLSRGALVRRGLPAPVLAGGAKSHGVDHRCPLSRDDWSAGPPGSRTADLRPTCVGLKCLPPRRAVSRPPRVRGNTLAARHLRSVRLCRVRSVTLSPHRQALQSGLCGAPFDVRLACPTPFSPPPHDPRWTIACPRA